MSGLWLLQQAVTVIHWMSIVSVSASELQFYKEKIMRLEMEVITLQEELIIAKTHPPSDQYKVKYEILLDKLSAQDSEKQEKQNKASSDKEEELREVNRQWELKLEEANRAWQFRLEEQSRQWANETGRVRQREQGNEGKVVQLELKVIELQRKLDEGDGQMIRAQLATIKEENQQVLKEQREAYAECQQRIQRMRKDCEIRLEDCREREKGYYRDEINDLRSRIAEMEEEVELWKSRVSPEREEELASTREELKRVKDEQAEEIGRLAAVLEKRNKEHQQYRAEVERKEKVHLANMQDLNGQLYQYEQKSYNYRREREVEMKQLQMEMTRKREAEFEELREQVGRMEGEFEKDKQNMRRVEHESQVEVTRIRREWDTAKDKYMEEKMRLKDKIADLKNRLKEAEERDNSQLLAALEQANSQDDNNFGNYDNAITFMDRQVKKTSHKVQEKDREITRLLEEMRNLQQETDREIQYVREKAKQEQNQLMNKMFRLESELDMTTHALRLKEKNLIKRDSELAAEKEGKTLEVAHLRKIIEEMERDFDRMVGRKKSLEDSYREERENVITGKVDINQEKKKKWSELQNQKKNLQLVFRERQSQIKSNFEVELERVKRDRQAACEEREKLRAQVQMLRQQLDEPDDKENRYVQYQKQLATLDLEIALTQNLFTTLTSATTRQNQHHKTQLDVLSEGLSEKMSSNHSLQLRDSGQVEQSGVNPSGEASNDLRATFSFTPHNLFKQG